MNFLWRQGARDVATPASPSYVDDTAEYRQVTVLFADIVGFTRISSEIDPEELHGLVGRFCDVIDGIIESYSGTVEKHIGDAVMAMFGAPVAHSDDPSRAVRAALEIHAVMPSLSAELGRELAVHIGIASGTVVAGRLGAGDLQRYAVIGHPVNLAARLEAQAGAGETLISSSVRRAVSGLAECDCLGDIALRGLDKPVSVWRVRDLREVDALHRRTPFVNRVSELGQFTGALASCLESGKGSTFFVHGEAGIGKSRLVAEFGCIAENKGFAIHHGWAIEFGARRGEDPIRSVVRSCLGIPASADDTGVAAAADNAVERGLLKPEQRVFLHDFLHLPQDDHLRLTYDAMDNAARNRAKEDLIWTLVTTASSQRPTLITIDDIQWLDKRSLEYVAVISRAASQCPALFLMTSRTEDDPTNQVWWRDIRDSERIAVDLGPLPRQEAMVLAGNLTWAGNPVAVDCIDRAGGNPLFLEQLLESVEESDEAEIPATIQSLVLSRMDRLPPGDKETLLAASVIGQRFSLEVLTHMLGDSRHACETLVEHRLIHPKGGDFLFHHALVQESVYSSLLTAKRRELHRKAAEWFKNVDPILYAEHLDRAAEPAAARAYLEAARQLAADYRHGRAEKLASRGLDLTSDKAILYQLLYLKGTVLTDLAAYSEAIETFRRAADTAEGDADRSRAWLGMAIGLDRLDRYREALSILDEAEQSVAKSSHSQILAEIYLRRGRIYHPLGELDNCLNANQRAYELAGQTSSVAIQVVALSGLGFAYYQRGRMMTANEHFNRCIESSLEHSLERIATETYHMRGHTLFYKLAPDAAILDGQSAVRAAERIGDQRTLLHGKRLIGLMLVEMAEWERGRQQLQECLALAQRLEAKRYEPVILAGIATVYAAGGQETETDDVLDEAYRKSCESGDQLFGPLVLGAIARTTNDENRRSWALLEGERLLAAGGVSHNVLWFYRDAMDAALNVHDWSEVERYARILENYTQQEPLPWSTFYIARARELAKHGRGERSAVRIEALQGLRDRAVEAQMRSALPSLDRVLSTLV